MADYRHTLQQLEDAWSTCTGCNLGVRRQELDTRFVFGEGAPGGIMFIGQDGIQEKEEHEGMPFISPSGMILRLAIEKLGLNCSSYITNSVACRPCSQPVNGEGQPMTRYNYRTKQHEPVINDDEPNPQQVAACLSRIHQQIYLVDPVIIVTLGGVAAMALTSDRSFNIKAKRGVSQEILVPGALHVASLTEKKKDWVRKLRGEVIMPTKVGMIGYHMLPTYDPSIVLRRQEDQSFKNPMDMFLQDMKRAATIYDDYVYKVHGTAKPAREVTLADVTETD